MFWEKNDSTCAPLVATWFAYSLIDHWNPFTRGDLRILRKARDHILIGIALRKICAMLLRSTCELGAMGAVVTAANVRAMPAGLRPGSLPG